MASRAELSKIQIVSPFQKAYDFEVRDPHVILAHFVSLRPVLLLTVVAYLLCIYFGPKYMRNRPAYKLKTPLFLWNTSLAIFSIFCTFRGLPEFAYNVSKPDGVYMVMCAWDDHNYGTAFWGLMFVLSKFVELGDTAFIILRKQKLIFLHWFHHVATLVLCWFGAEYYDATTRLYFINTFVHSFMYTYYALAVLKIRIPRKLAMALTTMQILQMFLALGLNFASMYYMAQGRYCNRSRIVIYLMMAVVAVVVSLFINFFVQTYVKPKPRPKKVQ